MHDSSTLLTKANNCFSTKVNHGRSEPPTKETVLEQLRATEDCMNRFPSSHYNKNKNGEKYREPIFMELKICNDIIGAHYNDMIMQDGRNKVAVGNTETKCPTSLNTKEYVICTKMIPNRKPVCTGSH